MKLEVVVLGVSDVDRAKAFYEKLGWRLDADFAAGDFRVVQLTPHNSHASVIFGKGITSPKPGSAGGLILAVDDIDAARADLIARGVRVSEVFHYAGGPFNNAGENPRVGGRTRKVVPTSRSPRSRIRTGTAGCSRRSRRGFPAASGSRRRHGGGRRGPCGAPPRDVGAPRRLEKTHAEHHWWDWYAPYLSARRTAAVRRRPRRRRPPHGGSPSRPSSMTAVPHSRDGVPRPSDDTFLGDAARALRDPFAPRRGRNGGGLSGAGPEAGSRRCGEGPAPVRGRRSGLPRSVRARGERGRRTVPSEHPRDPRFGNQDGVAFVVMELLEGKTLRENWMPVRFRRKAVDYAQQVAKGLSAAHEKGSSTGT